MTGLRLFILLISLGCLSSTLLASPIVSSKQLILLNQSSDWQKEKEWLLYQEGTKALEAKAFDDAESAFQDSLKTNPAFFPAMLGLADIAFHKQDMTQARDHLQKAIKTAPDSPSAHTAWAKYLYLNKQYPEAELSFKNAIQLNAAFVEPKLELASLYLLRLNQSEKAMDLYREVLSLIPDHAPAHYGLISTNLAIGDIKGVETSASAALERLPNDPQIHDLLGTAYIQQGDTQKAIASFEQAVALDKDRYLSIRNLSDLYFAENRIDDAIELLEGVSPSLAEASEFRYKLALAYQLSSRFEEAKHTYEALLDAQPDNLAALNNLANLLLEKGQHFNPQRAVRLALRATQLAPDNANYLDTLGWALYKHGDRAGARNALSKALEMDPDFSAAAKHLKEIDG